MDPAEQARLARLLDAPPPDPEPPSQPAFTAAVMAALPERPDPLARPASGLAGGWWLGLAAAAALAWWLPGELDPVLAVPLEWATPLEALELPWLELLAASACCAALVVLRRIYSDGEVAV
ncbi:hypothetical protein LBMAG53_12130 [Planctomycetota bacterium]|nr:hypothetical protein LBMAG53_12130 [Planctomycetota bacterium]